MADLFARTGSGPQIARDLGRSDVAMTAVPFRYERWPNEAYFSLEAREMIAALLRTGPMPRRIWEPHAGAGHLARELVDKGHSVVASDLNAYEPIAHAPKIRTGYDFLAQTEAPEGVGAIVMNPPFDSAEEHCEQAIRLMARLRGGVVACLNRSEWGTAKRRGDLIHRHPAFDMKLELFKRPYWKERTGNPAEDKSPRHYFAWFVWRMDRPHDAPPRIAWGWG